MADPTDDDASADEGADVEAADAAADEGSDDLPVDATGGTDDATGAGSRADADGSSAVTTTKRTPARRRPDPRADVAARRAATKARMDAAGDAEADDATARPNLAKGATSAVSADDPTGAKARRAARAAATAGKATAEDPTGARARREQEARAKKVARPSKRTGGAVQPKAASSAARSGNPKKAATAAESTRYTAPIPRSQLESPAWVPALMFTLLGLGGVTILATYVLWDGRPLTLGLGLMMILGGILTATQYR